MLFFIQICSVVVFVRFVIYEHKIFFFTYYILLYVINACPWLKRKDIHGELIFADGVVLLPASSRLLFIIEYIAL